MVCKKSCYFPCILEEIVEWKFRQILRLNLRERIRQTSMSSSSCNGINSRRYFDLYTISFHLLKIIFSYWISQYPHKPLLCSPFKKKLTTTLSIQFKFIANVNNDSFFLFAAFLISKRGFNFILYASHLNHLLVSRI